MFVVYHVNWFCRSNNHSHRFDLLSVRVIILIKESSKKSNNDNNKELLLIE
jgi:hypothetical protein